VLYVPSLTKNLLSCSKARESGVHVLFQDKCSITNVSGELIGEVTEDRGLYYIHTIPPHITNHTACAAYLAKQVDPIDLWHQRLGHIGADHLCLLLKNQGSIQADMSKRLDFCKGCIQGKIHHTNINKSPVARATAKGELIYTDICGPMSKPSLGGAAYFLTFTDDYSRYTEVYFLSHKNQALKKLHKFHAEVRNQFGINIKAICSDRGGEYLGHAFEDYLAENGIHCQSTVPYTPEQNGISERKNRTLCEMGCSMINHAGLPIEYWAEAVHMANYINNRMPTK
jgi:hypothetical protein